MGFNYMKQFLGGKNKALPNSRIRRVSQQQLDELVKYGVKGWIMSMLSKAAAYNIYLIDMNDSIRRIEVQDNITLQAADLPDLVSQIKNVQKNQSSYERVTASVVAAANTVLTHTKDGYGAIVNHTFTDGSQHSKKSYKVTNSSANAGVSYSYTIYPTLDREILGEEWMVLCVGDNKGEELVLSVPDFVTTIEADEPIASTVFESRLLTTRDL